MELFINIHKHGATGKPGEIINIIAGKDSVSKNLLCTTGIHPWHITAENETQLIAEIRNMALLNNVLAIGECGLDKVCPTDFTLQKHVFNEQIKIAKEHKKPLIIHCVRAYEDVLDILKENQVSVPVIFHGFTKKYNLAKQLINAGYYISYGHKLVTDSGVAETFRLMPVEKIFLETDNHDSPIEDIYSVASEIKNITVKELCMQITENVNKIFGDKLFLRDE